jgi:hypothetical protein
VQRLERELGVRLVERSTHHVSLTAAGAAFLVEARQILAHVDRAAGVARSAVGAAATLRVGIIDSSYDSMPQILVAQGRCLYCVPSSCIAALPGTIWRPLTEPASYYPWSVLWRAAQSWLRALRDGQIGAALARSATARSTPSPARSPASTARPLAATAASSAPRDSPQQHHEPQNDHIITFSLEVELSGLMLLKIQNYVNVAKVLKQTRTPVLRSL